MCPSTAELGRTPRRGRDGCLRRIDGGCDNGLAESFNGLYKAELIFHEGPWAGAEEVEWAMLTYVDWFNHRRLRGTRDRAESL